MHKMQLYEAPEAELLDVRFEEGFLNVSQNGAFGDTNADPDDQSGNGDSWWGNN